MQIARKEFRAELIKWLKMLPVDNLPKDTNEFIRLVADHYGKMGASDLHNLFKDEEDLREWIFETCLESGRFEMTEDGSDLRIKETT